MSQFLKVRSSGADVVNLQTSLNFPGVAQPALKVGGMFGPKTQAAVIAFQKSVLLMADGVVGPNTGQALAAAVVERVMAGAG